MCFQNSLANLAVKRIGMMNLISIMKKEPNAKKEWGSAVPIYG